MALYQRYPPLIITAFVAITMIVAFYFVIPEISNLATVITSWAIIIATVILGVGAVNLSLVHGRRAIRRTGYWYLSIWLLFIMFFTIGLGLAVTTSGLQYRWFYDNVYMYSYNAVWTLLAFSSISAAYRAFKARSIETVILFITTLLVIMRSAPIGEVLWSGFPIAGNWILNVPAMAAFRGIIIGSGIGIVVLGLRTLLGLERGWLSGG